MVYGVSTLKAPFGVHLAVNAITTGKKPVNGYKLLELSTGGYFTALKGGVKFTQGL